VMYVARKYKDAFMQDSVAIQQLPAMEFIWSWPKHKN
jgi:hypothetical protein